MGLDVNVLCRNLDDDRVIPRFSRYLRDYLGWNLTSKPDPSADVYYLSGYFEYGFMKRDMSDRPIAAYFTHLETHPPGNGKAKLFHSLGKTLDLRIVTAQMYADILQHYGPTIQIAPPVELGRMTISKRASANPATLVCGFSGYTYGNGRKGEDLAKLLVDSKIGKSVIWKASGRGWPVPTKKYSWQEMAKFYQSLDVLVVTSKVEGVPMPPLEALACGTSIVIPRGVGLLDELPDVEGVYRYKVGDFGELKDAFGCAVERRKNVIREDLRHMIRGHTVENWCRQHRAIFAELF